MPVDKPKAGETKDEFLAYCIPEEINNGMEQDQAVAVCISYYDKDKMGKIKDTTSKVMASVVYNTKFRGINLQAAGLEDACWEGYEPIGTKDMDGREVPNCVPIKEDQYGTKNIRFRTKDGTCSKRLGRVERVNEYTFIPNKQSTNTNKRINTQ